MNSVSTYNARSTKSIALSVDPNLFEPDLKRQARASVDIGEPYSSAKFKQESSDYPGLPSNQVRTHKPMLADELDSAV